MKLSPKIAYGMAFVLVGLGLSVWGYNGFPFSFSSTSAAWVQAIGSVAGIFTAAGVAWWQQRIARDAQAAADQRENTARYFRARRVLQRFRDRIDREIAHAERTQLGYITSVQKRKVAAELRELEGELIFMRDIGGHTMTAMDAYRRAHGLIKHDQLDYMARATYLWELENAAEACRSALNGVGAHIEGNR